MKGTPGRHSAHVPTFVLCFAVGGCRESGYVDVGIFERARGVPSLTLWSIMLVGVDASERLGLCLCEFMSGN